MRPELSLTVSEFVALLNQTLEYAYPSVTIVGELANFRVSKGMWVYFDLKDEGATVRFFGTVYQLPGPLEDGMLVSVKGTPKLHPQFGFSVTVQSIRPEGEGAIKKAAQLLEAKLAAEGLFDPARKRLLPYPPASIGLITSEESAAYRDFVKVINARWGGIEIFHVDVQVQGEAAPVQIVTAIEQLNQLPVPPEVLVVIRGGGSAEDLQAFSTEQVTRAVAMSRIPTVVAIGHEKDLALAELAADQRASTPSNAAELLVPDRKAARIAVQAQRKHLATLASQVIGDARHALDAYSKELNRGVQEVITISRQKLDLRAQILAAFNPQAALQRGYAVVRQGGQVVRTGKKLRTGDELTIQLQDAQIISDVKQVTMES